MGNSKSEPLTAMKLKNSLAKVSQPEKIYKRYIYPRRRKFRFNTYFGTYSVFY